MHFHHLVKLFLLLGIQDPPFLQKNLCRLKLEMITILVNGFLETINFIFIGIGRGHLMLQPFFVALNARQQVGCVSLPLVIQAVQCITLRGKTNPGYPSSLPDSLAGRQR